MASGSLSVALIQEVFVGAETDTTDGRLAADRLRERLSEARASGATLAVLPELPLQLWVPETRNSRTDDAELPEGPRHRALGSAARAARIGLLGGAIVTDASASERRNRALLFDAEGQLVATYDKLHLPDEEGFWETHHYTVGSEPPSRIDGFDMSLGVQICSDLFRPEGCHLLGALGAEAILAPRATSPDNYEGWKARVVANALTSRAYVVCVNRPATNSPVPLGGPSIVAAPDGRVILETTDPLRVVKLEREEIERAGKAYPGYLPVRAGLYARGWANASEIKI